VLAHLVAANLTLNPHTQNPRMRDPDSLREPVGHPPARLERKHQWAITAILPEAHRSVRLYPVGSGQSSAALKSTPQKDFRFSDSGE